MSESWIHPFVPAASNHGFQPKYPTIPLCTLDDSDLTVQGFYFEGVCFMSLPLPAELNDTEEPKWRLSWVIRSPDPPPLTCFVTFLFNSSASLIFKADLWSVAELVSFFQTFGFRRYENGSQGKRNTIKRELVCSVITLCSFRHYSLFIPAEEYLSP